MTRPHRGEGFNRLVIAGGAYGQERSEYCCDACLAKTLDKNTAVKRIDRHIPRADELCPQCGARVSA